MRCLSLFLTVLSLAAAPPAPRVRTKGPLARRIEAIRDTLPASRRAFWGINVVQLSTGNRLYAANPDRLFAPASNTKLFTTALGLMRLGPDYRFETTVRADAPVRASGRLAGDLRLVGGGDPALSARLIPYQKQQAAGDPLQAIDSLAAQVFEAGVRRIDGDIVGDDSAYVWEPYPDGWSQEDTVWDYGAPVSALTVTDNVFWLRVRANAGIPEISLSPALEFYSIDNRIRVAPGLPTKIKLERLLGSNQIRVWGTIAPGAETQMLVAIHDPAMYAARALADALTRRGVSIGGRPTVRHRFANEAAPETTGVVLARRQSPPLLDLLQVIDKVSQNLHAELVLREVERVRKGLGTREAALEEERSFLREVGITAEELGFSDGSGLSGMNLVSPEAVTKLLRYMDRSPHRAAWTSLLPVGAEDGTLATRFDGAPSARRIHAKTGSLAHVAALSGYIDSRTRGRLVFSILVNNFDAPAAGIRATIDRIALLLAE